MTNKEIKLIITDMKDLLEKEKEILHLDDRAITVIIYSLKYYLDELKRKIKGGN